MGRLPLELEEKRRRLAHAVQRGAFDSYIRHGRVPETYSRIAEMASEAKNLGDGVALPTPGVSRLPSGRPTNHYTWRTAGDHKVRNAHAALNGRVFCWANPPEHGHPGSEPNCRCWPEPYYGDPTVPDALLALARQRQVDTGRRELWASIETVTRPDGSLAQSVIVTHDGATIHSALSGSSVTQTVWFPDQSRLQILQDGEARSYATGNGQSLQVAWLGRALFPRFLPPLPLPAVPSPLRYPEGQAPTDRLITPAAIILRGAAVLYQMLTSAPQATGASPVDTPAMAFGAWDYSSAGRDVAPVMTGTLTEEQAAQFCPLLPQAQAWADEAAAFYEPVRPILGPQVFGISVHTWVKNAAEAVGSPNLKAEYTIDPEQNDVPGRYAALGSLRLDLIHYVPETGLRVYLTSRPEMRTLIHRAFFRSQLRLPGISVLFSSSLSR